MDAIGKRHSLYTVAFLWICSGSSLLFGCRFLWMLARADLQCWLMPKRSAEKAIAFLERLPPQARERFLKSAMRRR